MSDVSDKKISVFLEGRLVGMVKTMTDKGMSMSINEPMRMGSTPTFGLSLPGSLKIIHVNAIVINASPKGVDVGFLENDRQTTAGIMGMLDKTATDLKSIIEHENVNEPEPEPIIDTDPGFDLVSGSDYSQDLYMKPAKKKVLIVEDSLQILNVYKSRLLLDGYDVSGVTSAEQAIVHLRDKGKPDLMLLDLVMPGMDGGKLLQFIRGSSDLKDIKVIILSAKGESSEIDKVMALGISGYLIKTTTSPIKLSSELKAFFAFN
jgi:two-component system phosphate regulon response regulator PhoB